MKMEKESERTLTDKKQSHKAMSKKATKFESKLEIAKKDKKNLKLELKAAILEAQVLKEMLKSNEITVKTKDKEIKHLKKKLAKLEKIMILRSKANMSMVSHIDIRKRKADLDFIDEENESQYAKEPISHREMENLQEKESEEDDPMINTKQATISTNSNVQDNLNSQRFFKNQSLPKLPHYSESQKNSQIAMSSRGHGSRRSFDIKNLKVKSTQRVKAWEERYEHNFEKYMVDIKNNKNPATVSDAMKNIIQPLVDHQSFSDFKGRSHILKNSKLHFRSSIGQPSLKVLSSVQPSSLMDLAESPGLDYLNSYEQKKTRKRPLNQDILEATEWTTKQDEDEIHQEEFLGQAEIGNGHRGEF